jgi:hypothetical protein
MFNPLLPDLSNLKNEDIDTKISELMQKYFLAAKFGQGAVCSQIGIILEAYKYEQSKRHITASQKMANQNRNLDDFINVDH